MIFGQKGTSDSGLPDRNCRNGETVMEQKLYHFFYQIKKEHYYRVTFVAVLLISFLGFSFAGLMPGGSKGIFTCDMYGQYYAFLKGLRRMVWEGASFRYSFELGFGMGLAGWLSYYLMSPFNLIIILLPESMLSFGIMCMILLKLSVAGGVFTWFLQKVLKQKGTETIYCGILYALCGYAVNYYFVIMWLDALILLPIVLYQAKQLADEGKMLGFVISLAVLFLDNYYMAYMIGIFTFAVFVGYRSYQKKKAGDSKAEGKKAAFFVYLKFFLSVIWAFAISAFLMIPTVLSMMSRLGADASDWELFAFSLDPFRFVNNLFLDSYTTIESGMPLIYCGLMTVLMVPLYFMNRRIPKKEKTFAIIALVGLYLVMLIPLTDVLMHIGSRPTWFHYRYSFLFSFVLLILLCRQLSFLKEMEAKDKKRIGCVTGVVIGFLVVLYLVVLILSCAGYEAVADFTEPVGFLDMNAGKLLLNVGFLLALCFIIIKVKKKEEKKFACYMLLTAELVVHVMTTAGHMNEELGFQMPENIAAYEATLGKQLDELPEEELLQYRLLKNYHATYNDSVAQGYRGYESFCSVYSDSLRQVLEGLGAWVNWWEYHDLGITELTGSILNIGYRLHDKNEDMFAISSSLEIEEPYIEKMPYALPIGVMASEQLQSVTMEKQNGEYDIVENHRKVLAAFTGTDEYDDCIRRIDQKEITCRLDNVERILTEDGTGDTCYRKINPAKDSFIEYRVTVPDHCSAYYYFDVGNKRQKLTIGTSMESGADSIWLDGENTQVSYNVQMSKGESESSGGTKEVSVTINFEEEEEFRVQNETFFMIDVSKYEQAYQKLKGHTLEIEQIEDGMLAGKVEAEEDRLLFLSIPYESGWKVFVDGEEKEVIPVLADSMIGVPVEEGEHDVKLVYKMPGKKVGIILSLAAILLWIICAVRGCLYEKNYSS